MAIAICHRLTFLWLALLAVTSQPDASIIHLGSSGSSSRSSTVIGNDDFSDDPTHSLVSTFSIPTDLAVSSVNAPSHLPLGPRQSPGSRLSSNTSRRHHLVPRAKCPKSPLPRKIGYYQVDNLRKRQCHRIVPSQIITTGLSHFYLAFASIDPKTFDVVPAHPDDVGLYGDFTARKTSSMQTWIVVGGWQLGGAGTATRQTWKLMTSRVDARKGFITSLGDFMKENGFQGVELDWEYPSAADRGGSINDAANYVALVREMRATWGKDYGISVTLPPDTYLSGFDPRGMEPYIDFFNYLSYDLRAPPIADTTVSSHTDVRKIEEATVALWTTHVNPKKVNLGMSKAGRGYTLSDLKCSHSDCHVTGPSKPGPCTGEAGLLANFEINDLIRDKHLKAQLVPNTMSKEVSWSDQWIGFDDDESLGMKTDWASENCFGGTTLWSLDLDSGEGSGSKPDGATSASPSTKSGQPIMPVMPVVPTPGKSTAPASTPNHSSTEPGSESGSKYSRSSTQAGFVLSSKPPSSGNAATSTASGQTPAAALVIPGIATIPSATVAPGPMIVVGAVAVSGLVPLGVAVQKGLSEGQKATTNIAKSNSPKSDDVMEALGILAAAYASIQILGKEAAMLDINTLPGDIKPVIEKFETSMPLILTGTKDAITHLTDSIKDPATVNKNELKKADQLLGEQCSVTRQVSPNIKPLTDWKLPKGANDIVLPGILTLPSPVLGDSWRGTVIPGTLTVHSPSIPLDAALLSLGGGGGGAAGAGSTGGGGGGDGGPDLLSGLLGLAKQAEGAVRNAVDVVNSLSNLCRRDKSSCSVSFPKLYDAVGQLMSATEDVGGLGAGLDAIELDTFPPADISRVISVQNANRSLFDLLRGTLGDLGRIITNPPRALQLLKKQSPAYVAGGAVLALLSQSNGGSIGALPWNAVGAKKGRNDYFLVTVPNTTVKAFQGFIQNLPGRGVGPQQLYDWPRQYQTYLGRMTRQEAEAVNKDRIVAVIGPNRMRVINEPIIKEPKPIAKGHALSRSDHGSNGTIPKRQIPINPPRPWQFERRAPDALQLQMLSFRPHLSIRTLQAHGQRPIDHYLHEITSGRGATIYVLGRGFHFRHEEFERDGVENGPYPGQGLIVPPGDPSAPSQRIYDGEGDVLAALASGDKLGVANKANLIGVETTDQGGEESVANAYAYWRLILRDVRRKRLEGKAVTSYGGSWRYGHMFENNYHVDYARWLVNQPRLGDFFLPILADLWTADIVTVFGAGEDFHHEATVSRHLGYWSPHRFANANNGVIVVGGTTKTGGKTLHSRSNRVVGPGNPYEPTLTGAFTVYACAEGVDIIDTSSPPRGGRREYTKASGNGLVAPQIAGLAAYYLTLPGEEWSENGPRSYVAALVKNWISVTRRQPPRSPDGHDIANNYAFDSLPTCDRPGSNIYSSGNEGGFLPPRPMPPGLLPGRRWAVNVSDLIFKRQEKARETTIWENGHLTDPKYSNMFTCKLPGGYQPLYQPDTSLPITNETCYSDPQFKGASISFHESDMALFINHSCTTLNSFPSHQMRPAKNDKDVDLWLIARNVSKPIDFQKEDCLTGFYLALNSCDEEQPDRKFGGDLQVGDIHYFVYASQASVPPTSSSKAPEPSPPPAPPQQGDPNGLVAATKDLHCHEPTNRKVPLFHPFEPADMYAFIKQSCRLQDRKAPQMDDFSFTNNGDVTLVASTTGRKKKTPWEAECIRGFNTTVDSCDKNSAVHYGGAVIIDDVDFGAAAFTTDIDPKDCKCSPKTFITPFRRSDAINWIRDTCDGPSTFTFEVTQFSEPDHRPRVKFHVQAVEGKQVQGFDQTICTKGFKAAVDHCNDGKDKDKEDLWGGECTVANLVFAVTLPKSPPTGPTNKQNGKPTKDNRFGKHGAFGLG